MNAQLNISLQYFTSENKDVLQGLLHQLQNVNTRLIDTDLPANILFEILDHNKNEYGAGMGYFIDDEGNILGIGGLHYLNDVSLYETVCYTTAKYAHLKTDMISHILHEAFVSHNMDKICTRAEPGSEENTLLKSLGFSLIDERAFAEDNMECIWNYYELENEQLMVSSDASNADHSDWDSIF